jgi:hypothetical protein
MKDVGWYKQKKTYVKRIMFWSPASLPFEVMYHTSVLITTLQKNLVAEYCIQSCIMKNGEWYVHSMFLQEFFTAPKIVT